MWRVVETVILLSLLSLGAQSQAYEITYEHALVQKSCQHFLQSKCDKLYPFLIRSIESCQINVKAHDCEKMAHVHPEIANLVASCKPEEFCREQTQSDADEALSCLKGAKDSVVDTFESVSALVETAWQKFQDKRARRTAFVERCEKTIACKRELAKNLPFYAKFSDEKLQTYSADSLLRLVQERDVYKADGFINDPASNPEPVSFKLSETQQKMAELWKRAEALTAEKYQQFNCFTPEAKKEFKCYVYASVIDPTILLGKAKNLSQARRLVMAIESEKEIATLSAHEAGLLTKTRSAEQLTKTFLYYSPTTKEQNLKWMSLAERIKAIKDLKFFDVENSVMKFLNDTIKDKNLVTSLTNFHKEILQTKIEKLVAELKTQYPNLEVMAYSDFKSSRFAFKGRGPPDLEQRLNDLLKETNTAFTDYVIKNNIIEAKAHPENWFRAGFGETADQATLASRFSRQLANNSLQNYSSAEMKATLAEKLKVVESQRASLQKELGHTSIVEGSAKKTLSADALDILRKNGDDILKAQADLKNRFGLSELSTDAVRKMQDYARSVDEFAPGIHIAERQVANLDAAHWGGFSADMAGMGAKNLSGTAKALSESKNIDDVLAQTRKAEQIVTENFNIQKQTFQNVVTEVVGASRIKTVCSGDDCIAIPLQILSGREKQQILQKLSDAGYSSDFRLSFIPDKISDVAARNQLSVHGESIEKVLRKNLADKIEPAKLKGVIFGVDMKTTELNRGSVDLIMAKHSDVSLSTAEEKIIAENFKKAVEKVNADLIKDGKPAGYFVHQP